MSGAITARVADANGNGHGGKGAQTKAAIVQAALKLAQQVGLEGLSIGALAEATQMSKSGVFAHFGSREDLQIAVLHGYSERFEHAVFQPAMRCPHGLPRLECMFEAWAQQVGSAQGVGCIFISGAAEFDDRPGPVRDALVQALDTWHAALRRAIEQAQQEGQLQADAEPAQVAFEIHALVLALHFEARFMRWAAAPDRARDGLCPPAAAPSEDRDGCRLNDPPRRAIDR